MNNLQPRAIRFMAKSESVTWENQNPSPCGSPILKRVRKIHPISASSQVSSQYNSSTKTDTFSQKTADAKAWPIVSGILHTIISLTVLFTCINSWLLANRIEIPAGTILLYSGDLSTLNSATHHWLLCDGSEVSRSAYKDLFNVIGTTYGDGDGNDTFNLPDFRARFPLGSNNSDNSELVSGGNSSHLITLTEMPNHSHDTGTLEILSDGLHSHGYADPGHNHGGSTSPGPFSVGTFAMNSGGHGNDMGTHTHSIATDTTKITILSNGSHTHGIQGATAVNGSNQPIDIMPPYQTIHYIIRA